VPLSKNETVMAKMEITHLASRDATGKGSIVY
jgi:hypothetical protein